MRQGRHVYEGEEDADNYRDAARGGDLNEMARLVRRLERGTRKYRRGFIDRAKQLGVGGFHAEKKDDRGEDSNGP